MHPAATAFELPTAHACRQVPLKSRQSADLEALDMVVHVILQRQ